MPPKVIQSKVKNQEQKDVERKLENATEPVQLKTYSLEDRKKITEARTLLGLSQKELAMRLNVTQSEINLLESGRATYNGQFLSRVKRFLKIT